jgi:hypothetical protein
MLSVNTLLFLGGELDHMACSTKKENQIEKLWNNGNTEF